MCACAVSLDLHRYLVQIDERARRELFVERCASELSEGDSCFVLDQLVTPGDVIADADFEKLFAVLSELLNGSPVKAQALLRSVVFDDGSAKVNRMLDQK